MKTIINGMTGAIENVSSSDTIKPLSKNAKRKAKRYGKVKTLTAVAKGGKGIQSEYYNFFDSHNICRNPRTILIAQGY